jgi:hypothetical protein
MQDQADQENHDQPHPDQPIRSGDGCDCVAENLERPFVLEKRMVAVDGGEYIGLRETVVEGVVARDEVKTEIWGVKEEESLGREEDHQRREEQMVYAIELRREAAIYFGFSYQLAAPRLRFRSSLRLKTVAAPRVRSNPESHHR